MVTQSLSLHSTPILMEKSDLSTAGYFQRVRIVSRWNSLTAK
jgi:hypothetical protein